MYSFVASVLALGGAFLAAPGCADDRGPTGGAREQAARGDPTADFPVRFALEPRGESGVAGEVTIEPVGEATSKVTVIVNHGGGAATRAAIHGGTCGDLGSEARIPLGTVTDGRATRLVDRSLTSLVGPDLVVAVSGRGDDYLACAPIPDAPQSEIEAG